MRVPSKSVLKPHPTMWEIWRLWPLGRDQVQMRLREQSPYNGMNALIKGCRDMRSLSLHACTKGRSCEELTRNRSPPRTCPCCTLISDCQLPEPWEKSICWLSPLIHGTDTPHFTVLHFTALWKCCIFYKLKVCGHRAWSKSLRAVFPIASAHLASGSHFG